MALWNIIMSRSWLCFHCFAVDVHQYCVSVMRSTIATSVSMRDIIFPEAQVLSTNKGLCFNPINRTSVSHAPWRMSTFQFTIYYPLISLFSVNCSFHCFHGQSSSNVYTVVFHAVKYSYGAMFNEYSNLLWIVCF